MKYIALSKRYWRLYREGGLLPGDSHLYWSLMHEFNERGNGELWPGSIQMTDGAVATLAGVNVKTVDAARKRLQAKGLLDFDILGQGSRSGNVYRLLDINSKPPSTSPITSPKNGESNGEVDEVNRLTSPKNGEVIGEVIGEVTGQLPPSLPQQHLQQHTQKLEKSHIYNEFQTPDLETQTLKKNSESAGEAELVLQNQKPENAPTPPHPPASPTDPFLFRSHSEKANVPFSTWYTAYKYNWSEDQCRRLWLDLTNEERLKAMDHTPAYVKANPDKRFRLLPANYLTDKAFNNEIVDRNGKSTSDPTGTGQREIIRTNYSAKKFARPVGGRNG